MPSLFLDTERMANLNSGMGQLCLNLGRELIRQKPADWHITVLVSAEQVGIFGPSVRYRVATKWNRWLRFWQYNVWHCPYQDTHYAPTRPTRFIYTVLDLNYLSISQYSNQQKNRRQARYQAHIQKAEVITTISAYVADEVRRQLTVPDQTPVKVIYCGVTRPDPLPATPPTVRPDGPFLFFIGLLQSYKNVHTLLPLLVAYPDYRLVLAGPGKPEYIAQLQQQARDLGVADRLLLPGPVDEATKWWLYTQCDAFLFPSLLEGFGIPVIEAMSVGKPVFCSPLTSLPEVGGTEAFYFADFGADTIIDTFAAGMASYRADPAMPERLRQQSRTFSWETAAAAYWALYQQVD